MQRRVVLITGANSGLGLETTRARAAHGAHVVLACRELEKAQHARDSLEAAMPRASLAGANLDLASLASIRAFARSFSKQHSRLGWLFNHAG